MLNHKDFTQSPPDLQTEHPTTGHVATRPAGPDDRCFTCGAIIGGIVTEVTVSPVEVRFYCEFCELDDDEPLPFALTHAGTEATQ